MPKVSVKQNVNSPALAGTCSLQVHFINLITLNFLDQQIFHNPVHDTA